MKKILSIILALGLVLSMSLAAMPAAAQNDCEATVAVAPACAEGTGAVYTITFDSKYQMLAGNDEFVIEFPAGTGFGAVVTATVDGTAATATVDGLLVYVSVPANIAAADSVIIVITGVTNPAEGEYTLNVWVDMLCCPLELIACGEYEIDPKYSTYKFVLDFGDTYLGIGEDVIPLFKACGQDSPYGVENPNGPDGNLYTEFDIILTTDVLGCEGYDPVIINFWLEDAPAGATATIILYGWHGDPFVLDHHEFELTLDDEDPWQWGFAPDGFALPADFVGNTESYVHFDIPGTYEICFELKYLGDPTPCNPIAGGILAERCVTAEVLQDKDTAEIDPFGAKWNFFSTPLRLAYDAIDDVFAPVEHNLKAVWHWDNVQGKWFYYSPNSGLPAGSQPLSTIEDGKGYMVRMKTLYEGFVGPNPNLWLFGHAQAYAPNAPFSYNVATGWTMMGFTSLFGGPAATYLAPATPLAGGILGLSGNAYVPVVNFDPGFGYWVYFTAPGTVVP